MCGGANDDASTEKRAEWNQQMSRRDLLLCTGVTALGQAESGTYPAGFSAVSGYVWIIRMGEIEVRCKDVFSLSK